MARKKKKKKKKGAAVGNSIDANNRPIALRAFTVHTGGKERERESTKGTTMCRLERGDATDDDDVRQVHRC